MIAGEVLKTLGRCPEESRQSDRQTATKLGVNPMALIAWLAGRDRPQRCIIGEVTRFF